MKAYLIVLCALLCAPVLAADQTDPWQLPPHEPSVLAAGRLQRAPKLDGDLSEWSDALRIRIGTPLDVAHTAPGHTWQGAADASARFMAGWTTEGFHLAVAVRDDELINRHDGVKVWRQDSLELIVDARQAARLKTRRSPGLLKLFVRPPLKQSPAAITFVDPRSNEGFQVAGAATADGYAVEVTLPWGTLPGDGPADARPLAVQCVLNDADARDGATHQPRQLSIGGVRHPVRHPRHLIGLKLAPESSRPAAVDFQLRSTLRAPTGVLRDGMVEVNLHPAAGVAEPEEVRLEFIRSGLPPLRVRPESTDGPVVTWRAPTELIAPGAHLLRVEARDADGVLGLWQRPLLQLAGVFGPARQTLQDADVAAIAARDPLAATPWLGLAAACERLKRSAHEGDLKSIRALAGEIEARRQILGRGGIDKPEAVAPLHRLLALATDPHSQVVVEYPAPDTAHVAFVCGGLPLVGVEVREHATAAQALATLRLDTGVLRRFRRHRTVRGHPGATTRAWWQIVDATPDEAYRPERVLLLPTDARSIFSIPAEDLPLARVDAVVLLEGADAAMTHRVRAWAESRELPTLSLDEARDYEGALAVAGVTQPAQAPALLAGRHALRTARARSGFCSVEMVRDHLTLRVTSPCEPLAWAALDLVIAGRPVKPAQVDALAALLLERMGGAPGTAEADARQALYCGDIHMHTIYSDGQTTPAALMLAAMHAHLQFAVVTDHNNIAGGTAARRVMKQCGFAFPVTVGTEITTRWGHFNAWPLDEPIDWQVSEGEVQAFTQAAHDQGAVIIWNHPGYPGSAWDISQQVRQLQGTKLDAWEHYPARYETWKQEGKLPVLVGSTDTHNGTFSMLERSLFDSASAGGADLAEALRAGQVAIWDPYHPEIVLGNSDIRDRVRRELADPAALRRTHGARLKKALGEAQAVKLLDHGPVEAVPPEELRLDGRPGRGQ